MRALEGSERRQEKCCDYDENASGYLFDAVGNLLEVVDPLGGSTTFVYDAENRLTTRTLANGVVTTYTYDLRDRPLSVVHTNAGGTVLASRTYVRAGGGEPTRITKEDGSYVLVGYDSALRIVSERYFDALNVMEEEISYAYDADGNRTSKTVNGVVSAYAYASGGRLIGVTTNGVTESRTTDTGGRETSLAVMSRQLALTYDSDDHVTRVVDGANTTTFAFDSAGRRTAVTAVGTTKRFLTAPNLGDGYESPQAITDGSGAEIASFVYAGEQPLAKLTATGPEYYLTDAMGTVIGTADDTGDVVNMLDYDAFGNERGLTVGVAGETHGDFRLHGMWQDPSGLYYVRARVYDAASGRFTSRDPAGGWTERAETFGPYVFAASCPHVFADPDGRFFVELMISLSARLHITAITVASYAATHLARMGALRAASFAAPALLRGIQILGTKDQAIFRRFSELVAIQGARGIQQVTALAQAVTEVIGKSGQVHLLGRFAGHPVFGSQITRFGLAVTEVGTFLVQVGKDGIAHVIGRL